MALAPRLELRQSQQLVMTPQLQQAIKLLQLSNIELTEFVEQQLEENPFLERSEDRPEQRNRATDGDGSDQSSRESSPSETATSENQGERDINASEHDSEQDNARLDLLGDGSHAKAEEAIDASFDEDGQARAGDGNDAGYAVNEWANSGSGGSFEEGRSAEETHTSELSLREHLTNQLQVSSPDGQVQFVASYIIDLIDDAGYLRESLTDIADRLGAELAEAEAALDLIQTFDPSGVGARDLKECMRLQLTDNDRLDPAMDAFINNIELLAKGDLKGLMRATKSDEDDVRDMIAEVRALNPKPGYAYGADHVQVVQPDVFVRKAQDGAWQVELNNDTLPKVLVNQAYFTKVTGGPKSKGPAKKTETDKDAEYVNEQFANASWLVKSLDQRARTILKVAEEIVRQQDGFLAYGVRHLRPLNLRAVADAIEMHESTVSRVTSNKYIATPRGVFELKYFFTASISSKDGGEAYSAEAIRHRIKELIDGEEPNAVLSDDRLVELLGKEGVEIARRTVAKYRETLGIPSSIQRRRAAVRAAM
ncbi:MAG: RNA polymerase factor sigma-54 [Pseudomonadota bacterium]